MRSTVVLSFVGLFSIPSSFHTEAFLVAPSTSTYCRTPNVDVETPICPFAPSTRYATTAILFRTKRTRSSGVTGVVQATTTNPAVALPAAVKLQAELRQLVAGTRHGIDANPGQRELIEQKAQELNALNPVKSPALSPLHAGRWKVLYTTLPGPSSGRVGPFVGNVFQEIHLEEKRILNILQLGPRWAIRGALEADTEILDDENWAIIFDLVYNDFAGIRVQETKFDPVNTARRIWTMTYLDEGFRIIYARQEGAPASEGYIAITERDRENDA